MTGATTLRHRRATALSLSTSSFGTSLYKRLASGNHNNIVFSPLSVYTALTMTLLGAGGDTERELKVRKPCCSSTVQSLGWGEVFKHGLGSKNTKITPTHTPSAGKIYEVCRRYCVQVYDPPYTRLRWEGVKLCTRWRSREPLISMTIQINNR